MKLSRFTEKYLEIVDSLPTKKELLVYTAKIQKEALEEIKTKGQTLSFYNNEAGVV